MLRDEPHPCPYLAGRTAKDEFTWFKVLPDRIYLDLMNRGFRRSGQIVYRPICDDCRECRPIRVRVDRFKASRSQRRILRRNRDVTVEAAQPEMTDEKWRLYQAYLAHQHDGTMSSDRDSLERFLYTSPTTTLEMVYRLGKEIVGIGLVDVSAMCLSSVYFFFDPGEARRGLGTFSILCEIDACARTGRPYWYGGYYVRDCDRMNYKANFKPYELLDPDGIWREAAIDE